MISAGVESTTYRELLADGIHYFVWCIFTLFWNETVKQLPSGCMSAKVQNIAIKTNHSKELGVLRHPFRVSIVRYLMYFRATNGYNIDRTEFRIIGLLIALRRFRSLI